MEELLKESKEQTHNKSESERENYLEDRLENYRKYVYLSVNKRLCNTERYCKQYETYRVVKRDDGKEYIGKRSLCLVLTDDHKSCRRSGSRCDCAKHDSRRKRKLVGHKEVQTDESCINDQSRKYRLNYSDDGRLLTRLLELSESELVSDGKRDKSKCDVRKQAKGLDLIHTCKSESLDAERAEKVRTDQNSCNEICRDCGELYELRKS